MFPCFEMFKYSFYKTENPPKPLMFDVSINKVKYGLNC